MCRLPKHTSSSEPAAQPFGSACHVVRQGGEKKPGVLPQAPKGFAKERNNCWQPKLLNMLKWAFKSCQKDKLTSRWAKSGPSKWIELLLIDTSYEYGPLPRTWESMGIHSSYEPYTTRWVIWKVSFSFRAVTFLFLSDEDTSWVFSPLPISCRRRHGSSVVFFSTCRANTLLWHV